MVKIWFSKPMMKGSNSFSPEKRFYLKKYDKSRFNL